MSIIDTLPAPSGPPFIVTSTSGTGVSSPSSQRGPSEAPYTTVLIGPGKYFAIPLLERFSRERGCFVLVGRSSDSLEPLVEQLRRYDIMVSTVIADVSDPSHFTSTLHDALQTLPPLRYVIYNVKKSPQSGAFDLAQEDFVDAFTANVAGALTTLQTVARLPSRDHPTTVLLTGGGFKDTPDPSRLALSISKAALHALALAMAQRGNVLGIQVKTLVVDGCVRSDGPITPEHVAEAMWRLANTPNRRVLRVSRRTSMASRQLVLFS